MRILGGLFILSSLLFIILEYVMKVRYKPTLMIVSFLLLLPAAIAQAVHEGKPITPYGDSCMRCSDYGTCKYTLSHEDAKKAMMDYYHKKGFIVEMILKKGRFIKAKVKDKNKVVDIIIFDRRTGRLRSIY